MSIEDKGVGLRLDNYPLDEKKFRWILAQEGCHPKAAERILNRISLNGYDLLTVMSRLHFDWIIEQLFEIGVVVTFIEPLENWTPRFNDGNWPKEAIPDKFKLTANPSKYKNLKAQEPKAGSL